RSLLDLSLSRFLAFFECSRHLRDLPSFPTRRSSDLTGRAAFLQLGLRRLVHFHRAHELRRQQRIADAAPDVVPLAQHEPIRRPEDRKSTRLNSSHVKISYAVFCLKKKKTHYRGNTQI